MTDDYRDLSFWHDSLPDGSLTPRRLSLRRATAWMPMSPSSAAA